MNNAIFSKRNLIFLVIAFIFYVSVWGVIKWQGGPEYQRRGDTHYNFKVSAGSLEPGEKLVTAGKDVFLVEKDLEKGKVCVLKDFSGEIKGRKEIGPEERCALVNGKIVVWSGGKINLEGSQVACPEKYDLDFLQQIGAYVFYGCKKLIKESELAYVDYAFGLFDLRNKSSHKIPIKDLLEPWSDGEKLIFVSSEPFLEEHKVYYYDKETGRFRETKNLHPLQKGSDFFICDGEKLCNSRGEKLLNTSINRDKYDCFLGLGAEFLFGLDKNEGWMVIYNKSDKNLSEFTNLLQEFIPSCQNIKAIFGGRDFIDIQLNNDIILNIKRVN